MELNSSEFSQGALPKYLRRPPHLVDFMLRVVNHMDGRVSPATCKSVGNIMGALVLGLVTSPYQYNTTCLDSSRC